MESKKQNLINSGEKIAIIGAGPSGVHMATELRKRGFDNITIFEKTDRIGGKTRSIVRNNVYHEMGTTGFSITDESGLKPLIEDLFSDIEESCYEADIRTLRKHSFIVGKTKPTKFKTAQKSYNLFLQRKRFYKIYHRLVAKGFPYEIDENDEETISEISATMLEFMTKYNLLFLHKNLKKGFAAYGYGSLDKIPAYYGILLLERNYLSRPKYLVFKEGNDILWKTAVEKNNLSVLLNSQIEGIDYSKYEKTKIVRLKVKHANEERWENFNQVILTAPHLMTSLLPTVTAAIFKNVDSLKYIASLVDMSSRDKINKRFTAEYPMDFPRNYDYNTVMTANFGKIRTISDNSAGLDMNAQVCFQLSEKKEVSETICLDSIKEKLNDELRYNFDRKKGFNSVHKQQVWTHYFPHFNPTSIQQGVLQKISGQQGEKGLWYIGSSIAGELASLVMEFNKHIIERMDETFTNN